MPSERVILIVLVVVILMVLLSSLVWCCASKRTQNGFYSVRRTFPVLENLHPLRPVILNEVDQLNQVSSHPTISWKDWPERNLYATGGSWTVLPLFVFGTYAHHICVQLPVLTQFLRSIPGLKLAILSKMSPGTRLEPHQGWASHSNHVLRCHYGLDVPDHHSCTVMVGGRTRTHKNDEWIVFDDSLIHTASNNHAFLDRTVLIVDIERPARIPIGTSTVQDTKELLDIVHEFNVQNQSFVESQTPSVTAVSHNVSPSSTRLATSH